MPASFFALSFVPVLDSLNVANGCVCVCVLCIQCVLWWNYSGYEWICMSPFLFRGLNESFHWLSDQAYFVRCSAKFTFCRMCIPLNTLNLLKLRLFMRSMRSAGGSQTKTTSSRHPIELSAQRCVASTISRILRTLDAAQTKFLRLTREMGIKAKYKYVVQHIRHNRNWAQLFALLCFAKSGVRAERRDVMHYIWLK